MWPGCATCPHYGKVRSPLYIQGDNFISSEKDGFWLQVGMEDKPKYVPDYQGLLKKYVKSHRFLLNAGESIYAVLDSVNGIWNIYYHSNLKQFVADTNKFCQKHLRIPTNRGEIMAEKTKFVDFVKSEISNVSKREIDDARTISNALSFKNGVFNALTGEYLGDHNNHVITYKLSYNFDKDAHVPDIWIKTVNEWFRGNQNLIDQLGYMYAHVLFDTDYRFHNFHYVFGDGRNGKGIAMEILKTLIGGASGVQIKSLVDHKELRSLANNRLNISNEFDPNELKSSVISKLKEFTGGGEFEHSEKYEVKQVSKCVCKFVIVSNDIFKVTGAEKPVIARIRVLPFLGDFNSEDKVDPDLKSKLENPEVLSGIINWASEYGRKLFRMKIFPNPPECEAYLNDFMDKSDPLVQLAMCEYILCPKDLNGSVDKARIDQSLFFNIAKIYFREALGMKFVKWKNARDFTKDFAKIYFQKTGVNISIVKTKGYPTLVGIGFDIGGFMEGEAGIMLSQGELTMLKKGVFKTQDYNFSNRFSFKNDNGFHERASKVDDCNF